MHIILVKCSLVLILANASNHKEIKMFQYLLRFIGYRYKVKIKFCNKINHVTSISTKISQREDIWILHLMRLTIRSCVPWHSEMPRFIKFFSFNSYFVKDQFWFFVCANNLVLTFNELINVEKITVFLKWNDTMI